MIAEILLMLGSILCLLGSIGMLRFPDIYSRNCSQTLLSFGGFSVCLFGLMFQYPILTGKSFLALLIILLITPLQSYFIGEVTHSKKIKVLK